MDLRKKETVSIRKNRGFLGSNQKHQRKFYF
jgi:hypothetical protein